MIKQFSKKIKEQKVKNILLYTGEVKNIPTSKEKVDLVFSYATLYYVPDVEEVLIEIDRVLKSDGIAILEFGNSWSLEYLIGLVNHKIFGWSKHYCISPFKMKKLINDNLNIIKCRRFQLIPVASLPTFISKILKSFLGIKIFGKMIDEWLSNIWLFRIFAYKHIFVCVKRFKYMQYFSNL
jgi:ubiquinone/menaquinone biosynthesis C-methylase UbiE